MKKTLIAAALGISLAFSGSAFGQGYSYARYQATYYSNSQQTEVVGYVTVRCDGSAYSNGYLTPFYEEQWFDCPA